MFPFYTVPSSTMFSTMLNSAADSASPCLTPVDILKDLLLVFVISTLAMLPLNFIFISFIIFSGMP
jgi:O-antigen/teichoic acid export membrane protein